MDLMLSKRALFYINYGFNGLLSLKTTCRINEYNIWLAYFSVHMNDSGNTKIKINSFSK